MNQIEKNTVKAENQLAKNNYITFSGGKGVKILIAGNSITRHGPKSDIGWYGDWGMAASSAENDFVHILMQKVNEKCDARYCIAQVAEWERNCENAEKVLDLYTPARDFEADIIIARFLENCPIPIQSEEVFQRQYEGFINYLNKKANAKIIVTTSFWKHPCDGIVEGIAERKGYPLVKLNDLGELCEMKALGLFEHEGVAAHPGDLGMKNIAERIYKEIEKII